MTDFWEWQTYEDAMPFVAADTLELSVIEDMGGEEDGHRSVVLEATGSINFTGPEESVRILLDSDGVEYLRSALKQADERFLSALDLEGNQ